MKTSGKSWIEGQGGGQVIRGKEFCPKSWILGDLVHNLEESLGDVTKLGQWFS